MVRSVGHYLQVGRHIAGMRSLGVLGSMLLAVRIEMAAGGLEIRSIAFSVLMHMDCVLALREVLEIQLDLDSIARGRKCGRPRILAVAGLEVHFQTFVLAHRSWRR